MSHDILIVDDEVVLREELAEFLNSQGLTCATARSGAEALNLVAERDFAVVVADIVMPGIDGLELVRRLQECSPESQVLIMTAHPTVDTAVSALRLGAIDYVTKPLILEDLLHKVKHLVEYRSQKLDLRWYRTQLASDHDFTKIVGRSPVMEEARRLTERVAATDSPVLITGESGTGKELIAHAIHHNGPRRDGRLVVMNCTAVPPTLIDGQLFGHVRGAYTGADQSAEGLFAAAHGGTLVLDEIADLPVELQPKLLRAIENQEVLPLGATRPVAVNVRIIALTNKDLKAELTRGAFRDDLFYRLSVFTINIPPLRERREDIPVLLRHFIDLLSRKLRRRVTGVTNEALRILMTHEWRGNVRELRNVVERAMILEDGDLISPASLPSTLLERTRSADLPAPLKQAVRNFEREYIQRFLHATDGDKAKAAELLGVSLSLLYRRLQELESGGESRLGSS